LEVSADVRASDGLTASVRAAHHRRRAVAGRRQLAAEPALQHADVPTGIAVGRALLAWRVAFPTSTWTWFYEGASATSALYAFREWNRAVGVDIRYALPIVPVAFAPRIEGRGGIAYTLDDPFRRRVRVFLEMRMDP